MAKNRNYSFRDVDMLLASRTIAEFFRDNIGELSTTRALWTEQYANDLIARIEAGIDHCLGVDVKQELRNATMVLTSIQVPARRDVSFFKTQIDADFMKDRERKTEILTTLGFTKHLRGVQLGSQDSLIQLLYSFKTNMTEQLRNEILAKGIDAGLIDRLSGYAETFSQADVTQESFKGSTKEITLEISDTFNAIYDEMISICKIARSYYRNEPLKKEEFTFKKIISSLGSSKKAHTVVQEAVE